MNNKLIFSFLAILLAVSLYGCNSMPEKPLFEASKQFDGAYRGTRIDVSNDSICRETSIIGDVKEGQANFKLTYNDTNLRGWIDQAGNLVLYDDNNHWNYDFKGKASDSKIEGEWSVGGAPCRGTWWVERYR